MIYEIVYTVPGVKKFSGSQDAVQLIKSVKFDSDSSDQIPISYDAVVIHVRPLEDGPVTVRVRPLEDR